jgi:hypothetical protein
MITEPPAQTTDDPSWPAGVLARRNPKSEARNSKQTPIRQIRKKKIQRLIVGLLFAALGYCRLFRILDFGIRILPVGPF